MQSLEVISVNLWQILISLVNLLILFLIIKKFLFGPVKKMLAKRQAELDERYQAADAAKARAEQDEMYWNEKKIGADAEADAILQRATENAKLRSDKILEDAKASADGIVRQAETEAELERRKAEEGMKREIVDVSAALTEKLLAREFKLEDHRSLIDSVIETIGENHHANK
ncbi:MAG: F0F1 ATP synthase subunit B [Clostridia bacterium]|nr:F0F1 ATP synthase subunit B [Clostridia bacterium]